MFDNSSKSQIETAKVDLFRRDYLWDLGIVLVLILATLVINSKMIREGLNGLGDLRWHVTWIQHFSKEMAEGIWYPRWLAGTNFGYGSPTFVFYPPLVYYLGSAFRLIGFNIEQTMVLLFSLGIFLSGICFYLYGRGKWGKIPSLVATLFYMTSPAIFGVNFGGLASLYAFSLIPLGVYLSDQAIAKSEWRIVLAGFWTVVALTHTPSLLIYAIAGLLYLLSFLLRRSLKAVILTLISMGIGLGMASFYLLPAILEQPFTGINYVVVFLGNLPGYTLKWSDLFKNGLFDSGFRDLFWACLFAAISLILWRKDFSKKRETWILIALTAIILFLMSDLSLWLWQSSSILQKLERPARLGVLAMFATAALSGLAMAAILQQRVPMRIFLSTIILISILFNLQSGLKNTYSSPALHSSTKGQVFIRKWLEILLYDPYSDKLIDVPEYRPLLPVQGSYPPFQRERYTDSGIPKHSRTSLAKINSPLAVPEIGQPRVSLLSGKADIEIVNWGSYWREIKVTAQEPSTIRIRTYYYPAWQLLVNQQAHPLEMSDDGTMLVKLEPGSYTLKLFYGWTVPFIAGSILSGLSFLLLLGWWLKIRKRKAVFKVLSQRNSH